MLSFSLINGKVENNSFRSSTNQAAEVVPPGQTNTGATTATTLVTITVRDVNDNGPRFSQDSYNATILENMQTGVPVNFQGPIMHVSDIDQVRTGQTYIHTHRHVCNLLQWETTLLLSLKTQDSAIYFIYCNMILHFCCY